MTYEMYSPQTIDDAIDVVRLINERFELDTGIVVFFRKDFEEQNLERPMTDAEWDVLSRDLWDAAYHTATDAISELRWADDLAAEDAAALATETENNNPAERD